MLDWALYLKVELKEWNLKCDDTTLNKVLASKVPGFSHVLAGNAYFVFYVGEIIGFVSLKLLSRW